MTWPRALLGTMAGTLLLAIGCYIWLAPTTPRPATDDELQRLEARFPSVRDTLDSLVVTCRRQTQLAEIRDSLFAAGESLRVRQLDRDYYARLAHFEPLFPAAILDSAIYIEAWRLTGHGWGSPSSSAGYAYSSRAGAQGQWFRKRLDEHWFLYSWPARRPV